MSGLLEFTIQVTVLAYDENDAVEAALLGAWQGHEITNVKECK